MELCEHWWGSAVSDSHMVIPESRLSGLGPPFSQPALPTQVAKENRNRTPSGVFGIWMQMTQDTCECEGSKDLGTHTLLQGSSTVTPLGTLPSHGQRGSLTPKSYLPPCPKPPFPFLTRSQPNLVVSSWSQNNLL